MAAKRPPPDAAFGFACCLDHAGCFGVGLAVVHLPCAPDDPAFVPLAEDFFAVFGLDDCQFFRDALTRSSKASSVSNQPLLASCPNMQNDQSTFVEEINNDKFDRNSPLDP